MQQILQDETRIQEEGGEIRTLDVANLRSITGSGRADQWRLLFSYVCRKLVPCSKWMLKAEQTLKKQIEIIGSWNIRFFASCVVLFLSLSLFLVFLLALALSQNSTS